MLLKLMKNKIAHLKSWQWFLLLYIGGTMTLIVTSYGIKLLISGLPS